YPSAFGYALNALDFYLSTPLEIAIVGNAEAPQLKTLLRVLRSSYLPNRIIVPCAKDFEKAAARLPLLEGRDTTATQPTAFVCQNRTCQTPAHSADELRSQIGQTHPQTTQR